MAKNSINCAMIPYDPPGLHRVHCVERKHQSAPNEREILLNFLIIKSTGRGICRLGVLTRLEIYGYPQCPKKTRKVTAYLIKLNYLTALRLLGEN